MNCEMIVEQLGSQEYRMRYVPESGAFVQTPHRFLGHARHFVGVYGWIVGYGVPPLKHLDIMVPTTGEYSLGDTVQVRIVGCFKRNDGDHKFVAIEATRNERTLSELPEHEQTMLYRQYPEVCEHEARLEHGEAVALLQSLSDSGSLSRLLCKSPQTGTRPSNLIAR